MDGVMRKAWSKPSLTPHNPGTDNIFGMGRPSLYRSTIDGVPSKACLTAPGTALRVSSNVFGDGLWLTAVSGTRLFGYAYDPHKSGEIVVQPATACGR